MLFATEAHEACVLQAQEGARTELADKNCDSESKYPPPLGLNPSPALGVRGESGGIRGKGGPGGPPTPGESTSFYYFVRVLDIDRALRKHF